MNKPYYRPLLQCDLTRPDDALPLAGGWGWFNQVECLTREDPPRTLSVREVPQEYLDRLSAPRTSVAGLTFDQPRVMGILNVTPDSFSDGGQYDTTDDFVCAAEQMCAAGVDIIDVGGESTRPGAALVPQHEEIARIAPVISALREADIETPVSIDTRKCAVAQAAMQAGANIVNDVSGFTFDAELAPFCARLTLPVCVMHAQGDPATMQKNPQYGNVLLDVYDYLADRLDALEAQGVARDQIVVDPGIGFGKTMAHNLALLNRISLFHGLGAPILLGTSRKRFIGTIGNAPQPEARAPGSIATALAAIAQGIQIVRAHDVAETAQALALWSAVQAGEFGDG